MARLAASRPLRRLVITSGVVGALFAWRQRKLAVNSRIYGLS